MAYKIVNQVNSISTLENEETGHRVHVQATALLGNANYEIISIKGNLATLQDAEGNIIRGVRCVANLTESGGGGMDGVVTDNSLKGDGTDGSPLGISDTLNNTLETMSESIVTLTENAVQATDTLPIAEEGYVGRVFLYTGATTNNYKTGVTYECVDNGDDTYSWVAKGNFVSRTGDSISGDIIPETTASDVDTGVGLGDSEHVFKTVATKSIKFTPTLSEVDGSPSIDTIEMPTFSVKKNTDAWRLEFLTNLHLESTGEDFNNITILPPGSSDAYTGSPRPGSRSVSVGGVCNGANSVLVGYALDGITGEYSVGVGYNVVGSGTSCIAIGRGSIMNGSQNVVLGNQARALQNATNSIAIGNRAYVGSSATGNTTNTVVIGANSKSYFGSNIVIGANSTAGMISSEANSGANNILIGNQLTTTNGLFTKTQNSICIGSSPSALASGKFVSIGHSMTPGSGTVAIGYGLKDAPSGINAIGYDIAIANLADGETAFATGCLYVSNNQISPVTKTYKLMDMNGIVPVQRLADTTGASAGDVLQLNSDLKAVWATPTSGGASIQMRVWGSNE